MQLLPSLLEDILEGHSGTLDFYDNVISPYKGGVEAWFVGKQTLSVYYPLILLTVWVVLFPKSDIVREFFRTCLRPQLV